MVSGIEISQKEKEFIIQNKDTKFPSQIARELGERFEPINGGYRSPRVVRQILKDI